MRLVKERRLVNPEHKIKFLNNIIGSGLYSGYIPFASGTFASLLACLILFIPGMNIILLGLITIIFFFIGLVSSNDMMKKYGTDPHEVVIDEIVGMWVTGLFIIHKFDNIDSMEVKLIMVGVGFLAFRFFDIVKFQLSKYFDEMKTPIGVMMDDVTAGIYAGIVTFVINSTIIVYIVQKGIVH